VSADDLAAIEAEDPVRAYSDEVHRWIADDCRGPMPSLPDDTAVAAHRRSLRLISDDLEGSRRIRGHLAWLEEQAVRPPPARDPYARRGINLAKAARSVRAELARGTPATPGTLGALFAMLSPRATPERAVDTVRTQLAIVARRGSPAQRARAGEVDAALSRRLPDDDAELAAILVGRRALGRAISLGLPAARTRTALDWLATSMERSS
jgi:hypothetical protein